MVEFLVLSIAIVLLYLFLPVVVGFYIIKYLLTGNKRELKVWFFRSAREIDVFANVVGCDLFNAIADVWYTVTLAEEGDLQIVTTISGTSDQANVTVYTSDSGLEEDEEIAFCSYESGGETISGNLVAGTYYIRVWSDGVASTRTEGTFDIVANFTGLSINDFDNPKLLGYFGINRNNNLKN